MYHGTAFCVCGCLAKGKGFVVVLLLYISSSSCQKVTSNIIIVKFYIKSNSSLFVSAQIGVPIRLLHEGEGHSVSIELKNGKNM